MPIENIEQQQSNEKVSEQQITDLFSQLNKPETQDLFKSAKDLQTSLKNNPNIENKNEELIA